MDRVQIFLVADARRPDRPGAADAVDSVPRPACTTALTAVTYERLGDAVLVSGYLPDSAPPDQQAPQAT